MQMRDLLAGICAAIHHHAVTVGKIQLVGQTAYDVPKMPEQRLVPALAGFNIGVELGQLLIVAALWCAARWTAQSWRVQNYRASLDAASALLCAVGSYWFVARSFGLD